MSGNGPISSDLFDCPECGSLDVEPLAEVFAVLRCFACGAHFDYPEEDSFGAPKGSARKMRHNKHREDGEWV